MPAGSDAQLGIAPVLDAFEVGIGQRVDYVARDAFAFGCPQQALALDGGCPAACPGVPRLVPPAKPYGPRLSGQRVPRLSRALSRLVAALVPLSHS